jgi:hypothetical protein
MESSTPVKQYALHLELPNSHTVIDVVGDDQGIAKETCQAIMKGGCRFEPFGNNSTLIYHPTVDAGKKAIGWLNTFEVPTHLSNKAWVERREQVAA